MKPKAPKPAALRNWVAKHARQFCKPAVFVNKKKTYTRTPKHRHRDFGASFCTTPVRLLAASFS